MIYLYDTLEKSYRNHRKQFDLDCKNKFGIALNDLKYKKSKSKDEVKFIRKVDYFSPILDTHCSMNKICHKIEHLEDNIKFDKDFSESILPRFIKNEYVIEEEKLDSLELIYKQYMSQKKFGHARRLFGELLNKDAQFEYLSQMKKNIVVEFRSKCYEVSTCTQELFEYMIALYLKYQKHEQPFECSFIWDILDEDILNVISCDSPLMCLADENGNEYLGRKYSLVEVQK